MRSEKFWDRLDSFGNAVALIDAITTEKWTYAQLEERVYHVAETLPSDIRTVSLLPLNNSIQDIVYYLGTLRAGHVPLLYNSQTSETSIRRLLDTYKPGIVSGIPAILASEKNYRFDAEAHGSQFGIMASDNGAKVHPQLGLLLLTSGSSGQPKLVRLSHSNVECNAHQIVEALEITRTDLAVTSVPLSYVYGLSVLHSHLAAGAGILVDQRSVLEKAFWKSVDDFKVTSFSGVPWTYQLMSGISGLEIPSNLVKYTTSGAKVSEALAGWMEERFADKKFYYMYGQTEASGRIAVLPSHLRSIKRGSVGRVVGGGWMRCSPDGALFYEGPNVMLGYANTIHDLILGDQLEGVLDTGDLGYLDRDDYVYLTGRRSRLAKLYGFRIDLDDIQSFFSENGISSIATAVSDEIISISVDRRIDSTIDRHVAHLAKSLGIPAHSLQVSEVSEIKRLSNGKVRYSEE